MSGELQAAGLYNQSLMNWLQKMGYATFGNVYYVDPTNGDDDNDGLTPAGAFATLDKANDTVTTNNDDFIILSAYAAHNVTEMLSVSKNRVHFVSAGWRPGSIGMGARSRVVMGVTTAATDLAVMQNTGVGNTFQGIKFDSSNTKDESLYSVVEAGEYTIYEGCEFYKSTDLDVSLAAEVANNGDSVQWINCTFGSSANIVADNCIRPNMLLSGGIVSGKKMRDNVIQNCLFLVKAAGTEAVRIYGANATDVERMLLVKNSTFFSNKLAAATPAHAVGFGAAQTEGSILLQDCASVDHTVMAQAAVGIYVAGAVPTFATTGVSVAS